MPCSEAFLKSWRRWKQFVWNIRVHMLCWKIWTVPTCEACSFVAGKNYGEWCKAKRVSLQLEILVREGDHWDHLWRLCWNLRSLDESSRWCVDLLTYGANFIRLLTFTAKLTRLGWRWRASFFSIPTSSAGNPWAPRCWAARDAFFACLDQGDGQMSPEVSSLASEPCLIGMKKPEKATRAQHKVW